MIIQPFHFCTEAYTFLSQANFLWLIILLLKFNYLNDATLFVVYIEIIYSKLKGFYNWAFNKPVLPIPLKIIDWITLYYSIYIIIIFLIIIIMNFDILIKFYF